MCVEVGGFCVHACVYACKNRCGCFCLCACTRVCASLFRVHVKSFFGRVPQPGASGFWNVGLSVPQIKLASTRWPLMHRTNEDPVSAAALTLSQLQVLAELGCACAKHSGQTFDKVYEDSDRDYWMRAEEAKKYGMIDEILVRDKS